MSNRYKETIRFIKGIYKKDTVPLHEPVFIGKEKEYVLECIESTFVSTIGMFVNRVEERLSEITGAKHVVVTVNGTAALHIALKLVGVEEDTEVITQPLTFVATCNAISYCGAKPVLVDIDPETLGMCPLSLKRFLERFSEIKKGVVYNRASGKRIAAVVPVHTFGHPCKIEEIRDICRMYDIPLVEDAAEALGTLYKESHVGIFGEAGILSFNGNKIVTAGGGGAILTNNDEIAERAKHITTTAKRPHKWEYFHDEIGYNYRMPNINAALLLGQLENLRYFLEVKRNLAAHYKKFFESIGIPFITEPSFARSNYWLNAIVLKDKRERDEFIRYSHENGVFVRPCWMTMNRLPMYEDCQTFELKNVHEIESRLVNIPSSVVA